MVSVELLIVVVVVEVEHSFEVMEVEEARSLAEVKVQDELKQEVEGAHSEMLEF